MKSMTVCWLLCCFSAFMVSSALQAQAPSDVRSGGSSREIMGQTPEVDLNRKAAGAGSTSQDDKPSSGSTPAEGDSFERETLRIKEWAASQAITLDMMWFVDSSAGTPKKRVREEVENIIKTLGGKNDKGKREYNVNLKVGVYGKASDFPRQWRGRMKQLMEKYFGDKKLFQVFDVDPRSGRKTLKVEHTRALHHAMEWLNTVDGPTIPKEYKDATGVYFFRDSPSEKSHKIFVFVTTDDSKKYPKPRKGFFSRLVFFVAAVVFVVATQGAGLTLLQGLALSGGAAFVRASYEENLRKKNREAYEQLMRMDKYRWHPKTGNFLDALVGKKGDGGRREGGRFAPGSEYERAHPYKNIDTWAFVGGGGKTPMDAWESCEVETSGDELTKVVHTNHYNVKIDYKVDWDVTGADKANNLQNTCKALRAHDQGAGGDGVSCEDDLDKGKFDKKFKHTTRCRALCEVDETTLEGRYKESLQDVGVNLTSDESSEAFEKFYDEISGTSGSKKCLLKREMIDTQLARRSPRVGRGLFGRSYSRGGITYRYTNAFPPPKIEFLAFGGKAYVGDHFKLSKGVCEALPQDFNSAKIDCPSMRLDSDDRDGYAGWAKKLSADDLKSHTCFQICGEGDEYWSKDCRVRRTGRQYLGLVKETGGISAPLCADWGDYYKHKPSSMSGLGQFKAAGITRLRSTFTLKKNIRELKSIKFKYSSGDDFIIDDKNNRCMLDKIKNFVRGKQVTLPLGYAAGDGDSSCNSAWKKLAKALQLEHDGDGDKAGLPSASEKRKEDKLPESIEFIYKPL